MNKHTPGPWKQSTRGPNGCPIIGDYHGLMVAMCAHSANESDHKEEAEANARLIAAAPELLKALRDIAALTTNEGTELEDLLADIQGVCRRVLTKATGE